MKSSSRPARSNVEAFIRAIINGKVDKEFSRMAAIIGDPSNPLKSASVIANNPAANPYFLRTLEKHGLKGQVINE